VKKTIFHANRRKAISTVGFVDKETSLLTASTCAALQHVPLSFVLNDGERFVVLDCIAVLYQRNVGFASDDRQEVRSSREG
jgi:hypothetical protein